MKQGERAKFVVQPDHAYGEAGDDKLGIPGGAVVTFEVVVGDRVHAVVSSVVDGADAVLGVQVVLHAWDDGIDPCELDQPARLELAKQLKVQG